MPMKRLFTTLFAIVFAVFFAAAPQDSEAGRLGGAKSFGMQRSVPTRPYSSTTTQRQPTAPATTPQKRSWLGPIAGLAAGLGLAALMSHLGFGEEMASFLLIALLVMGGLMLFNWLTRKSSPMQYAHAGTLGGNASPFQTGTATPTSGSSATATQPTGAFPPGFDADAFAREAKVNFIRLQAAYDAGNLDDLRAFTTPEIFAELRMQLAERAGPATPTDVVQLEASVLEAVDDGDLHVVSVRFDGQISEDGQAPVALNEIWHLSRPIRGGSGWVIAGIQQC